MFKNVASQKLIVFAFDSTTGLPKTGDAANLTAYVSKDYGTVTVLGDTSATEMDSTNAKGYYLFDLTQAETNGDCLLFSAKSSTSNIVAVGAPAAVFTFPATGILAPATAGRTLVVDASGLADANVVKLGPTGSGTAQTAKDLGALNVANVNTLAGHDPGATLGTSTLTQTQVTGGAYSVQSASCVLGDARVANLDAAVTTRMATYAQPTGFLAATFPGTVASTTNITAAAGCAVSSIGAGVITAASIAANAITAAKVATDAIGAAQLAADAVAEIQAGLSTYAGGDTSGTTTLLARLTALRAGYLDNLAAGAVALAGSAPSWYTSPLSASGVRSAVGLASANLDTQLAALDADVLTRLATSGYTAPLTTATTAEAVWRAGLSTAGLFNVVGSVGRVMSGLLNSFTSDISGVFTAQALANAPTGGGGSSITAADVWDLASSGHTTSGTFGALLATAGAAADPLLNTVPGSYASGTAGYALGRIGSGQIATTSVVAQSGNIAIVRGADYYAADGRSFDWTDTSAAWPVLTGATVSVHFFDVPSSPGNIASDPYSLTGSVVTATGSSKKVRLEMSAAQASALPEGDYLFGVFATLASGHAVELLRGRARVSNT